MRNIPDVLRELLTVPGATYSCAVVVDTGELLGAAGSDAVDPAAVLRWGRSVAAALVVDSDALEDVMVTSRRSYRLARQVGSGAGGLLVLLCLDRARANLAVARRELARACLPDGPVPSRTTAPHALSPGMQRTERPPGPAPGSPVPPGPPVLPRRVPAAVPPAPWGRHTAPTGPRPAPTSVVPAPRAAEGAPAAGAGRWADDVATMRRLLGALRALR